MDFTDADVADILALLDSLPYDELDLQTPRFRLTLRRTPGGWTQSAEVLSPPAAGAGAGASGTAEVPGAATEPAPPETAPETAGVRGAQAPSIGAGGTHAPSAGTGSGADGTGVTDGEHGDAGRGDGAGRGGGAGRDLVAVRAPLPGTFYRAPRPGAVPFVEVGSQVGVDTVIGIVETMKLMNSVPAGVAGTVAEFCVANGEFAAHGATLLRIRADR